MKLSIIGFGHMGSAIISGGLSSGVLAADDVTVWDKLPAAAEKARSLGVKVSKSCAESLNNAEVIIIAVKPADLETLAEEISGSIPKNAVIASICAGKHLDTLSRLFGADKKIVRIMPNTPALVGEGMSGICGNSKVSDDDFAKILELFRSFGRAELLPEELFDCVTAVSGSGPAYVYQFIIALINYAQSRGMTYEQAKAFAAQTVLGSAKMVLCSSEQPEQLLKNLCTPNGTTIEAIKVLDERGFSSIISDAASACEARSFDLGK